MQKVDNFTSVSNFISVLLYTSICFSSLVKNLSGFAASDSRLKHVAEE